MSAFSLVALAEIGDKSQLVCITLAARYPHWPVISGASLAFVVLNLLAVFFGAGVAAWLPENITALLVTLLFAGFGIHTLLAHDEEATQQFPERTINSIFVATFLMIFLAEFGDKTQIAVAGLASNLGVFSVWIGATLALILISVLGVWAGRTIMQRLPTAWLKRISGGLFIVFALVAAQRVFI